ncbi:MAG TPA: hypothetical protein VKB79_22255 [Bryobacteraceae bacterium]|nr:hypothetical protein [Bryobacteraceae bacterium]
MRYIALAFALLLIYSPAEAKTHQSSHNAKVKKPKVKAPKHAKPHKTHRNAAA